MAFDLLNDKEWLDFPQFPSDSVGRIESTPPVIVTHHCLLGMYAECGSTNTDGDDDERMSLFSLQPLACSKHILIFSSSLAHLCVYLYVIVCVDNQPLLPVQEGVYGNLVQQPLHRTTSRTSNTVPPASAPAPRQSAPSNVIPAPSASNSNRIPHSTPPTASDNGGGAGVNASAAPAGASAPAAASAAAPVPRRAGDDCSSTAPMATIPVPPSFRCAITGYDLVLGFLFLSLTPCSHSHSPTHTSHTSSFFCHIMVQRGDAGPAHGCGWAHIRERGHHHVAGVQFAVPAHKPAAERPHDTAQHPTAGRH